MPPALVPLAWLGRSSLSALASPTRAAGLALALIASAPLGTGCRKRATPAVPPPAADAGVAGYRCPPSIEIARAIVRSGRTAHVGCHAYAVGRFWLAAAFSHGAGGAEPRLELLSGGLGDRITVYEVLPGAAPAEALAALVRPGHEIEVTVRPGESEGRLLRLGVRALKAGAARADAESTELATLLQLVAHAPPKLLWVGEGDRTAVEGGCVVERRVGFQLLFGRVDMVVSERGRRTATAPASTDCGGGPGLQEPLPAQGVPLKAGRVVPFGAAKTGG